MEAVSIVVDEDLRWSEGRFHAAAIPAPVPVDVALVRFVNLGGVVCRVQVEETYSPRWLWPRLLANAAGTFVIVFVASLCFLILAPVVFGMRPVVVSSDSMAPALRTADAVVTKNPPELLPVGAVIDYRSGDRRFIHRIVEVTEAGYRTKGDSNQTPDSALVDHQQVTGVGVMVVPFAGLPVILADEGRWLELAGLASVLIAAGVASNRRWLAQPSGSAYAR